MLTEKEIMSMFDKSEVLLEGHFLLTSGRHSDRYLQCARVLQYPVFAEALCAELADRFRKEKVDICLGPALGGVIIAYETARSLGVHAIFTERDKEGKMALRRGFIINPGDRVLVLEDVITTGGSVIEVIDLVKNMGGIIAGVGAIVERGGGISFEAPFSALVQLEIQTFSYNDCPLCRQGIDVVKPGSRK